MSRPLSTSVAILDGKVRLYQRKAKVWQCAFAVDGNNFRHSTKKTDFEEAKVVASDLYHRARFRVQEGLPAVTRNFRSVANATVVILQKHLDEGTGKVSYQDSIEVINKWLIPHFGQKHINKIDAAEMAAFTRWRTEQMGKVPSRSTVTNHNVALNKVFDYGLERGFLTKSQIPVLKNEGEQGDRRPDFTIEEYKQLYRFMRKWIKQGKKGLITQKRELLRDYVLILANTGIRHGTESYGLKWKHLGFFQQDGKQYLSMHVDGKTGPREIVARHRTVSYLKRIQQRNPTLAAMTFEKLLDAKLDQAVFALPDGTPCDTLASTFKVLMNDANLLVDPLSGNERTLYSMRHVYATFSIVYGHMPYPILAKQMGTSIAMIEKHYSHLTTRLAASTIAGTSNK